MTTCEGRPDGAALCETYGESGGRAKRDQALALLFWRSNWTQEEGKSQSWVDYRLRFGGF